MSDPIASLPGKIGRTLVVRSVVGAMKAMVASSAPLWKASHRDIGMADRLSELNRHLDAGPVGAVVFGSDQDLVGRFNDVVAADAVEALSALPGRRVVWAVGERVYARLADAGLKLAGLFAVPQSVKDINPLVGQILAEREVRQGRGAAYPFHVFYNRRTSAAAHAPVRRRLLPLDDASYGGPADRPWPTKRRREVVVGGTAIPKELVREYVFVSLFRACSESLSSENASRLAAMQGAERNVGDRAGDLNGTFRRNSRPASTGSWST